MSEKLGEWIAESMLCVSCSCDCEWVIRRSARNECLLLLANPFRVYCDVGFEVIGMAERLPLGGTESDENSLDRGRDVLCASFCFVVVWLAGMI
jgi:hypothetical protein